jgi:outer membrane protein
MKKHILLLVICLMVLGSASFAQKFAYVNTDYILDNVPDYKDAQKQLDNLSVGWQKEIENKYSEIDKMYKSYQAEQILLTEDMKKKRESEIVAKEKEVKDLQKQRFGKDGDLFKKRQELVNIRFSML